MKRRISALLLVAVCLSMIFSACADNGNTDITTSSESESLTSTVTEVITDVSALPQDAKLIALTYDDGPYTKTTSRILDVLRKNNSI